MILNLNGEWKLKQVNGNISCKAVVPCCNFTALLKNKLIKDPFKSTYEKDVAWVGESDWIFSRSFIVDETILKSKYVLLKCDMLDTIATISINNNVVATTQNCFIAYEFDIKEYLVNGENVISIYFKSPVEYVKECQKREMVPRNSNGQNGIPHIRKPQCHFGWDWGPVLVPSGITKDISICYCDYLGIKDIQINQIHHDGIVDLNVSTESKDEQTHSWQVNLYDPKGILLETKSFTSNLVNEQFEIKSPQLWWTYELNKVETQPLYKVEVCILNKGKIVVRKQEKIGLRTIKLNQSSDKYGNNFCFELNGIPIFAKGANWIPPDSFIDRVDKGKIDFYLESARYANFNMIRIWGGGYYGDDYFYDKCDEKGILIWQDFMFACQPYPLFNETLLSNVKKEIQYNVNRLKNHPSLALWCGNNEIEAMDIAWKNRLKYITWTKKFFYDILPNEIQKYDKNTPYIPGTPVGSNYQKGVDSDNVGDTHLWAVWHGLQPLNYYRKRMTRFCSEFGFESLPDLKTIEFFAKASDYDLNSEVFKSHQKCLSGNKKMMYYIASRFNLPKKFEDYIYLSQICQLECIRDATEHWRRNKGRCNGSMYWQFNDCWPVCSWSSIDYFGNYKALHYGAHHFNNPIGLSILDDDKKVYVYATNDTLCDQNMYINIELMDFYGNRQFNIKKEIYVNKGKVMELEVLNKDDYPKIKDNVLVAKLFKDETLIDERTLLFDKEKNINLPTAKIKKEIKKDGDNIKITLSTSTYAHYVMIYHNKNNNHFSDNFFDLIPGENKEIYVKNYDDSLDYNVISLCDIDSDKNRIKENLIMLKVLLEPINFGQYLYYAFSTQNSKK